MALVAAGGLGTRYGPPVAIASVTVAVLLANTMPMGSGDTVPATFLPFVLLREGRLTFADPGYDRALGVQGERLPYYLVRTDVGLASKYSPAMALVAAPMYLPAALGRFDPHVASVLHLGKLAAALLTSIGIACLFVAARALVGGAWAAAAMGLYVLGTPVLSVLGQALWQHTGAALRAAWARAGLRPMVVGVVAISIATFAILTFVRPTPEFRELVLDMTRGPWDIESHPILALARRSR